MMRPATLLVLVIGLIASVTQAEDLSGETIMACGDGAGWPPYTYVKDGTVTGYDVDVLDAILTSTGADFEVEMPPWKRCLFQAEAGEYQIALSASYSQERDEKYILTDVYYTLQPSYIYDGNRYPQGLDINSADDILNYKACGLRGYNYDGFGVDSEQVDRNTNNFEQVTQKTLAGRCDLFLARFEILAGFSLTGQDYLKGGLTAEAIPGLKGDEFYMMVSRNYAKKDALVSTLNDGIARLKSDGALERLLSQYLPD